MWTDMLVTLKLRVDRSQHTAFSLEVASLPGTGLYFTQDLRCLHHSTSMEQDIRVAALTNYDQSAGTATSTAGI
jgi:hypothetical protein